MISFRHADLFDKMAPGGSKIQFSFTVSEHTRSYIPSEDVPIYITYIGCDFLDKEWKPLDKSLEHVKLKLEDEFTAWMKSFGFENQGGSLVYHGKVRPLTDAWGRLPGHRNTSQGLENDLRVTFDIEDM